MAKFSASIVTDTQVGKDVPDHLAFPALLRRLLARSQRTKSGCLEWTGFRGPAGYGLASFRNKHHPTHRLMYLLTKGPIPDGQIVRHTCDHPPCLEPDHLILGTHADNMRDSLERNRHHEARQTHCKRGHLLPAKDKDGRRHCNVCRHAVKSEPRRKPMPGHCAHGHALTDDNVYVKKSGHKECRRCRQISRGRFMASCRARILAAAPGAKP